MGLTEIILLMPPHLLRSGITVTDQVVGRLYMSAIVLANTSKLELKCTELKIMRYKTFVSRSHNIEKQSIMTSN